MPSSRFLISSQTLGSAAASVTFSSIPAGYTDLVLRISARSDRATDTQSIFLKFNGDGTTTKYSRTTVNGDGVNASSARQTNAATVVIPFITGTTATANTFNNVELYIPNYAGSTNKPYSAVGAPENNYYLVEYIEGVAGLYRETAAISSIQFTLPSGNFVSGSSFYLYGLRSS